MSQATTTNSSAKQEIDAGDWESQIATLLDELSAVQTDLLSVLEEKRQALVAGADSELLEPLQKREQELAERLSNCQQRRQSMLASASEAGLPDTNLRLLAESLPQENRNRLKPAIRQGQSRMRLLQHQSLTNWVLVQRTLLHLSQMVEIVATGGEKSPIYRKEGPSPAGGALLDCDA